jgi:hypothetical protein
MPMAIVDMRLGVTRPLGINVGGTQMPTDQIDLYLNRAFWEIQNKYPLRERQAISTFSTSIGIRNYEVSFPTESVDHIAITEKDSGQGRHYPLEQITRDMYEQKYEDSSDQWDIPIEYVREGCIVRMWPTPDDEYTITIRRNIALTDLGSIQTTSTIPQVWDEIIVIGGLWRACVDLGDIARSNFFKSLQTEMINTIVPTEANEAQSNSELAHVEVPGLEY